MTPNGLKITPSDEKKKNEKRARKEDKRADRKKKNISFNFSFDFFITLLINPDISTTLDKTHYDLKEVDKFILLRWSCSQSPAMRIWSSRVPGFFPEAREDCTIKVYALPYRPVEAKGSLLF